MRSCILYKKHAEVFAQGKNRPFRQKQVISWNKNFFPNCLINLRYEVEESDSLLRKKMCINVNENAVPFRNFLIITNTVNPNFRNSKFAVIGKLASNGREIFRCR